MNKLELSKRLKKVKGNSLLIQFCTKSEADLTYQSAEKLKDEGEANIGTLIRRDDFSIYIQANMK